ncbi:MAG: hypothetical protein HZA32_21400 [Opitutae bacterium]|nr:hypothetical protein [Opitutae bacterium]
MKSALLLLCAICVSAGCSTSTKQEADLGAAVAKKDLGVEWDVVGPLSKKGVIRSEFDAHAIKQALSGMDAGATAYVAFEVTSEQMSHSQSGELLVSADRELLVLVRDGKIVARFEKKRANQVPEPTSGLAPGRGSS